MKRIVLTTILAIVAFVAPKAAEQITIAQFLANQDTITYRLTGVITSIANTTYGNMYIEDETASLYIYGISEWSLYKDEIGEGDTLTVEGKYTTYKGSPQIKNAAYISHKKTETPWVPDTISISTFLSQKDTKVHILIGAVTSIDNATYGNLHIQDETGSVYVYNLTNAEGTAQSFNSLGVEVGDTLTLSGMYKNYNNTDEVTNARYISHVKQDKQDTTDYSKTEVDFATDFAFGWSGWIGKTLTFTNDFYVNNVNTPTASYMRLRNPEEYGDNNDNTGTPTIEYTKAEAHNTWANCNLSGIYFNYDERPGAIIRGMQATVTGANQLEVVNTPTIIYNSLPTERPDLGNANVVICGANIENFFVTIFDSCYACTQDEWKRAVQKQKISKGLYHIDADIYAICEMEQGPNAAPVMVHLLDSLAGKEQYDWVNAGFDYSDAVMVCFIYRKDKIMPIGNYLTPYSNTSSAYHYREGIQCFEHIESGERFNISINHFKAKGKSSSTDAQRQTNMNNLINYGLKSSAVLANSEDILVLGDLNAYTNEESNLKLSRDKGYIDLLMKYAPDDYSYVYNNTVGYLDHAYCSPSMESQVTKAVPYHLNADTYYTYEFGYGDESMYRYADHDPILVGLRLGSSATDVESVKDNTNSEWQKVIRHGQLIIIRGAEAYTITGQKLQ